MKITMHILAGVVAIFAVLNMILYGWSAGWFCTACWCLYYILKTPEYCIGG